MLFKEQNQPQNVLISNGPILLTLSSILRKNSFANKEVANAMFKTQLIGLQDIYSKMAYQKLPNSQKLIVLLKLSLGSILISIMRSIQIIRP